MKESKEFELQGDISSGFRWKERGKVEAEKEVFVPLGDSSRTAQIQNTGEMSKPSEKDVAPDPGYNRPYIPLKRQPSGTAIVFDLDYDLLFASEREARKQLLAPAMIPPALLKKLGPEKIVDPYVARELHRQELRDKELRDVLNALFGKAGNWRVGLCLEAQHNDHARGELACAVAIGDGTREADRFLAAFKVIALIKKRGPVKTAKAWALLFALGCRVRGEKMPTKGEVLRFLESKHIPFLKENAARDIFTGPILDALLRRRAGRPRETRRRRRK
jgi:hypothetical protein